MTKVSTFLPMRKGSERVIHKNIKEFAGIQGGLCHLKISQLLKASKIDKIIVSTDDVEVIEIAENFRDERVVIDIRPPELASSNASTDDLIRYVPSVIDNGAVLWTHVTSPFITASVYDKMVDMYFTALTSNDSLMTVTKFQKFLWNESEPVNYDYAKEKWPRSQTLKPLWEINSGAFIADVKEYTDRQDRIGANPYMFELSGYQAFDIDWPDDFDIAELYYERKFLE